MMNWFASGGYAMWPILFSALLAIGYAAAAVRARPEPGRARARRDGVLFWGTFAAALGVLGTLVGLAQMAQAIEVAGDVAPALFWGGVRVALITTVFGLLVFLASLLIWFGIRLSQPVEA